MCLEAKIPTESRFELLVRLKQNQNNSSRLFRNINAIDLTVQHFGIITTRRSDIRDSYLVIAINL